jgi:hypothetical protein
MNELGITMIYNVVKIKAADCPKVPRIVPKAVEEPVGAMAGAVRAGRAQVAEAPDHLRAHAHGFHASWRAVVQVVQQHLSNQIHAGPFLFEHIADYRYARWYLVPLARKNRGGGSATLHIYRCHLLNVLLDAQDDSRPSSLRQTRPG